MAKTEKLRSARPSWFVGASYGCLKGAGVTIVLHYSGSWDNRTAMARKPRVEYDGAFYHVICRGNQRQAIFRSDTDRKYYLERLEQYRERLRRHSVVRPSTTTLRYG